MTSDFGSAATDLIRSYVMPIISSFCVLAAFVCVLFISIGGVQYMISRGKPDNLGRAKRIIKNALIGLVLVLGAAALTTILSHAMGSQVTSGSSSLPKLTDITPASNSNVLVDVMLTAVTGFLNVIIQAIGAPFLSALSFFTSGTPLMEQNAAVFNMWLVMVGIADSLFVLVVALLGFHVMSSSVLGLNEVDIRQLLPRIGLIFLLMNISIFIIDGVIGLSNALITAINLAGGNATVWNTLTDVVKQSAGASIAALILMLLFLIFAVILLIFYVGRLVTLFIGAVLAPLILLLWLIPAFRDFVETAIKVYLMAIFVLFVHVVILLLAASLFVGMAGDVNNTIMAMIAGLATVLALLKTQGVMTQLSFASLGPRTARQLGGQFVNAVSTFNSARLGVASGLSSVASAATSPYKPSTFTPSYSNHPAATNSAPKSSGTRSIPSVTVVRVPAKTSNSSDTPSGGKTVVAQKRSSPHPAGEAKVASPIEKQSYKKGGKK
jgi:hypothetical protein